MTAYVTQKGVEEYILNALPLFEPMETDYNGGLCSELFSLMLENGGFGNLIDGMPQILQGQEIRFNFESPLLQAQSRANSQAFGAAAQILTQAMQLDPTVVHDFDIDKATRDAIEGTGAPADWLVPQEVADQAKAVAQQAAQQQAAEQNAIGQAGQVADVAQKAGDAGQSLGAAVGMQPPQPPQQRNKAA